jgi:hypothetical protein
MENDQQQIITQEKPELPAVSEAAGVMNLILKAGETMDPARLSQLMDLQERILNREAKQAFSVDYVRMKPLLPRVIRTKDNSQTRSKYAPLEDINDTVDPVLSEFGFATATKIVAQTPDSVTVEAELLHSGGHVERTQITMPLDNKGSQGTVNKTGPHATASSITYAKRVAICALLNISTGDDRDGNSTEDSNDVLEHEKAAEIDLLIAEVKADKVKFLSFMRVDDVRKIKAKDYLKAKNALNAKKKEGAKK